jgi:hypothetical protein
MDLEEYRKQINSKSIFIVFFYNLRYTELKNKIDILRTQCIKNYHNDIFCFIDCDNYSNNKLIESLFIKSVPLFHIYKNRELIEEIFGNYDNIYNIINAHI